MKALSLVVVCCIVTLTVLSPALADGPAGKRKASTSHRLSNFEVGRYQYCGQDSDCIVANNGCCDCNNGGQDVAINKENLERFRGRFSCNQVSCGLKPGPHPCGTGVISCIDHKCRYINDVEFDAKSGELKRNK